MALGILMDVTRHEEYSHIAIRNVLEKYQYLKKQDRAFITRAAQGTLERLTFPRSIPAWNTGRREKPSRLPPAGREPGAGAGNPDRGNTAGRIQPHCDPQCAG